MTYRASECLRSRDDFPALSRTINGKAIAFFDGPGGTQVPQCVIDAVSTGYVERNANFDGQFVTSREVGKAVTATRAAVAEQPSSCCC